MSAATSFEPMTTPKPRRVAINPRMLVVVAVFALLVGYPVFSVVKAQMNHGVEKVAGGYFVDLKSLGNFRFDERTGTLADVPERFRALDGKKVSLDGFMYSPTAAGDDLTAWEFVYNINKCCFTGPPQVQERVFAVSRGTVPYSGAMVRMTGTLHVNVRHAPDTGKALTVYMMDVKHVDQL